MSRLPDQLAWNEVLAAGVRAQQLIPEAVAVGGTAAALYAHHRISRDTDHLLTSLRDRFDEVRDALEASPDWKTARVQPPVLILGSLGGVQVGFRQSRRAMAIETRLADTPAGPLRIPTLDEMIGMKAYLAYARNATRDFVDFAALASCADPEEVLTSLLKSDPRYGSLQSGSVSMEIAKRLSDPHPYDLSEIDLRQYKGLDARWASWDSVAGSCRDIGEQFAKRLVVEGEP